MSEPYVAEIRAFPFNFAPRGWAICAGQILPISQNTALFSLIGTYYGGNGTSNFALPNLQGTVPVGQGQGPGLSPYVVGETVGVSSVTLTQQQMPGHQHTLAAFSGRGPQPDPVPTVHVLTSSGSSDVYDTAVPGTPALLDPSTVQSAGGGQAHNNLMPYLAITYCIALQGVFPAQLNRPVDVSLRPATAADDSFLHRLYASTRADELALTGWDEHAQDTFIRMQRTAQTRAYTVSHPYARCDIVLVDDRPAGRLYVDRAAAAIHVLDISLLPGHRGRGTGTRLLTALLTEAERTRRAVTLNVARFNRALSLYLRLGFTVTREDEVYLDLAWTAPTPTGDADGQAGAS